MSAVSEASGLAPTAKRPTWVSRPFMMVWAATFISLVGDGFTQIALSLWALQSTGSALPMTIILTARAVVGAVAGPLAGGLVDRMDRKTAMLLANGVRAATTVGLAYLVTRPASEVLYAVVALSVVGAAFGSLHEPARSASIVMLVGPDNLAKAASMMQLSGMVAMILGPVLGGVVVATSGVYAATLGDAISYVGAFLLILLAGKIANPPRSAAGAMGFWASMGEGVKFLRTNRLVGTFVLIVAPMITFCQSAIAVLFPVMAVVVWKVSGVTYGLLQGMFALGFAIALIGLGLRGDKLRRRGLVWGAGMISGGLLLATMGLVDVVWVVFPVLAGVGFTLAASNMVTQVAVQRETPPQVQGRVFGVQSSMLSVTTPVALSIVGLLTDTLGPALITSIAGILVAAIGVGGLLVPVIRRYELNAPTGS